MADALGLIYKGSAARPLRPRDGSGRTALTFAHPVSETRLVRFQRGPGTRGFRVLGESVTHQSFAGLADAAMHSPFKRDEAGSIPASRTILFEGSATLRCCALANCSRCYGARIGSPGLSTRALHSTGSGQSLLSSECRFEPGSAFQQIGDVVQRIEGARLRTLRSEFNSLHPFQS